MTKKDLKLKLKLLFFIYDNDKTPEYSYYKGGKHFLNGNNKAPDKGQRWMTPREIIRNKLGLDFWKLYNKYKKKEIGEIK